MTGIKKLVRGGGCLCGWVGLVLDKIVLHYNRTTLSQKICCNDPPPFTIQSSNSNAKFFDHNQKTRKIHNICRVRTTHCQLGKAHGRSPAVVGKRYSQSRPHPEAIACYPWARELASYIEATPPGSGRPRSSLQLACIFRIPNPSHLQARYRLRSLFPPP